MTAPTSGRDDATLRGAVVLVVAIVIGLALLWRSGDGGSTEASDTTTAATSTELDGSQPADPTQSTLAPIDTGGPPPTESSEPAGPDDTRAPEAVTAIVLNGSEVIGAAADNDGQLKAAGYTTIAAANANADLPVTTIYAGPEFQADAEAVRGVLGLPDAVIADKPEEPLGDGAEMADIVVVLGGDIGGG
ncbi:LytR C-terminal domain-containing protein [Iamia sp.]|uniref:LytR C-terminal domain-containing protein n=1 Tax=Iamia sp. TaxID=2722710 RepID=UPI002C8D6709|nr:LytR C-terminal domain-containing protein [Iamia sp.]HXH55939.1 LytR C-terminal domain-containing protein [Iamia sp.]